MSPSFSYLPRLGTIRIMHNYGEAGNCILPVHIGGEGREAFSAGKAGVGLGEGCGEFVGGIRTCEQALDGLEVGDFEFDGVFPGSSAVASDK